MKLLTRLKLIASGFGYDRDCNSRNYTREIDPPIGKCNACGPWADSVIHTLGLELMQVKQCRICGHMEKANEQR